MASDEDRIEAARFLRSCNCCGDSYVKCSEISEALFGNKNAICNSGASLEKIADLIDRPTCHNVADYTKESFRCSECGCRVLVPGGRPDGVLVVTSEAFPLDWYSCPVCGAVVLDEAH